MGKKFTDLHDNPALGLTPSLHIKVNAGQSHFWWFELGLYKGKKLKQSFDKAGKRKVRSVPGLPIFFFTMKGEVPNKKKSTISQKMSVMLLLFDRSIVGVPLHGNFSKMGAIQ